MTTPDPTPVTIITDKIEHTSLDILARQIEHEALRQGRTVTVVGETNKAYAAMPKTQVISVKDMDFHLYPDRFRFMRPKSFVTVLAANWEEHTTPSQMYLLTAHLSPTLSGVPIALVAHSPYTMAQVRDKARTYLAPSMAHRLRENTHQINCGIEADFEPGLNDPNVLVVPFTRHTAQKQPKLHYTLSRAYQLHQQKLRGVTPVHHYWHHKNTDIWDVPQHMRDVYTVDAQPADRAVFKDRIGNAGMFLSTSSFESFGLYYVELLCSGVVGVFLDRPWVRSLLPDYPWVASEADLPGMMNYVRDNYESCSENLATTRMALKARYSITEYASRLLALASALHRTQEPA